MITDYQTLQDAIADWLNRADLTAVIPTFVQLCDTELRRRIRTKFRQRLDLTVTSANAGTETIPGDAPNEISEFYIQSPTDYQGPVDPVAPNALYKHRQAYRNSNGRPLVVSIINQELLVSPIPDQDYDCEMIIEGPLVALSDSATSNYVLLNAPDVYLFGSLKHSAPYLKEDPRIQVWMGQFEKALAELEAERDRNEWPNTPIAPQPAAYGQDRGIIYP